MRLTGLPPEATEIARAVAILGDGTDVGTIATLAGHEPAQAARITGALARAEILRSGSSLGFAHPLVRSADLRGHAARRAAGAARQGREADARRRRHQREDRRPAPRRTRRAGSPGRSRSSPTPPPRRAGSGASDVALTLLTRLLDEPLEPGHRARVLLDLGLAEAKSTNGEAAVGHLRTAYETLEEPGLRAAASYALARTLLFIGEIQPASDFAAEASKALPPELRDVAQMVEAVELTTLYFGAKVPDVERRFRDLRELPENPTGGESVLAAAASYDWMYRGGTAAECADLASSASGLAAQMEVDTGLTWVVANVVLVAAERPEARDVWEQALARSHRQGSMFGVLTVQLWRGFTQLRHGELPAAEESLRAGIEQITLLGGATLDYAHGLLCSTLLEQGRIDEAEAALRAIERPAGIGDGPLLWRSAEIELLLARGSWEEALAAARTHAELCDWRTNPAFAQTLSFQGRALARLGRVDEAIDVLELELERAEAGARPARSGGPCGTSARSAARTGRRSSSARSSCSSARRCGSTSPRRTSPSAWPPGGPASRPRHGTRCGGPSSWPRSAARPGSRRRSAPSCTPPAPGREAAL